MRCLLVYDISHDRTRSHVADACLDYGLDRIQYSAFVGTLTRTHQQELMLKLKRLVRQYGGDIQLFPLCANDWDARQIIHQEIKARVEEST
jgi:CRISPR-associated protein Cas2